MQPPPQAVPSGVVRPPPSGSPQTMFWSNSPYRRQAGSHTPMAPITCPLQPVTDPFAFSRQALQSTSLGGSSKSSPPILQGPPSPSSLQRAGLPVPHTNTGDSSQGPCEPLPGPPVQPRADASPFPGAPMPSASHGPETNRSAKAPGPEPELPNPPYPPQYIPAVGSSGSRGGLPQGHVPRPDRPLSRPSPPDSAAPPAALPLPPQPCQQVPGQWGPGQGGPRPPGQQYWPGPEGPPQIPGPHASSVTHFPPLSSLHQHPGHEQLGPPASLPGPSASDGRNEAVCLPSGDHSANSFDPESAFRQNSRVGNARANQELRSSPGVNREQLSGLAAVSPLAQGNGLESHSHCSPGAGGAWTPLEAGSGALAMFFKGGETENEENLSLETAGSAGQADVDGFCLGQLPTRVGAGGAHQAFPRGSSGEPTQLGGEPQPYFPQSAGSPHEKAASKVATVDVWADTARAGAQYENVENLEFVQNQEVLPSEPLSMDPSSPGDLLRCGPLPGPAGPRLGAVGPVGGGGLNLEALDMTARPARSDSVSSGYSGKSHRGLPGARLRDSGTFIQQEVGKPEDESPGRFFKQIGSSPVGGETDETSSQNYLGSLSQPSTPSPPKPTGVFQTSANSSFEPVKSHLVGVKPIEADRANVVGEVRGPSARQQHRAAAATPDAAPGNLEQPPDNMETLFPPQRCVPPLATPLEAGRGLLQATGPPLETVLPTPEKRPSTRVQGPVKCESPATTLWAQNELPDFGGNVLLAPAAPALHVPVKPQPSEVIQPPDAGAARQVGSGGQSGDGLGASENLENPPQLGEEEALPPQAGPSYASLLSSPPAESLQNQPILIAQPDQSYRLAQPVNVSQSLPNPDEKAPSWRDSSAGDKPIVSGRAAGGDPGENVPLSGMPASSLICSPLPNHLAQSPFPQVSGTYDMVSNQAANLLVQPHSHPNALLPEGQKVHNAESVPPEEVPSPAGGAGLVLVPPASSTSLPDNSKPGLCGRRDGASGALDFMFGRTLENPAGVYSLAHVDGPASVQQPAASRRPPGPGANTLDRFYQQVMKEAHDQPGAERAQQELALPLPAPQGPRAVLPEPSNPGSPPVQAQPADPARPASPAPADAGQQLLPRPPRSSSASVVSTSSGQAAPRPDQQWLQPPPPDLASYFYYRPLYDGYQPPYPYSAYLPDPGPAPHYYQDIYGLYDPRYRPCDSAAYMDPCRYPEPERPSSRASHCSDRPAARQAYPEGYYNSKSGWSSQSDYYAGCYSSQYDYRDPGRWDRLYYSSRFRDPRSYDRRYWHDAEYDSCRKEGYACGDRPEKYDDRYRYDPRFTGSFDDEPEPPRDPYGEEADRRSEHSEHSARSLRSAPSLQSRRSSFSAHSQQSQVYRSHNVPSGSYEVPPPPGSFHGDYAYGPYGSDFHGAPGFPEYGYPAEASWPSVEQAPSRPSSPEKFSVPHVCARFGPGGQLIKVIPNLPSEGQPALVEIHSMETLLQHTPEQEEMRAFPGPLGKDDTHKVDVINFAQNKATKCLQNENLIDKESASLLWSFIVLLCRQNGTVVGTDIAELLLRDHRTVWLPGKSPNEANLIDFTNEAMEQVEEEESGEAQLSFLTDSQAASTLEKDTERFRELLLYGRKKDALESAMKSGLWGHALLLASKMDSRTHARVMTRFANSLPINDPLQTVYQLMSGRMPAASTCCGDEKWGDWRPHLAMILSNLSSNVDVESRAVAAMGDTLASKGLLDAAHFCYLMAQVGFGVYTKKTTKLVLIGSNHSLPFSKFATNEAIQRTEAYEYAQSLGAQACSPPSFQVFKFIYCCRLAEMGLAAQAFHYCEAIAKSVLAQPHRHSPVLLRQLVQVASQLRLFDPQLKEKPEEEASAEPAWLVQLQLVERRVEEGAVAWSQDGACPQRCPSSPSPEVGPRDGPGPTQPAGLGADNPLLAPPAPSTKLFSQDVRQLPSAPSALPAGPAAIPTQVPMFPVPLPAPVELEPVHGPPGAVPGFQEPSGPDPVALYPGPGVPPLQETDCLLPEARSQDAGAVPQETPGRSSLSEPGEEEFGGNFANTGSFRTSPGSEAPPQALQPPAPLTPAPEVQRPVPATKKESKEPKKSSESWFSRWLPVKKRTEAYLPDDKNKSIVWDEKKNRWVDVNEPEEEKKAPPPPPTALPKAPQAAHPVPGGPPRPTVNIYSRKAAGTRARYVDVLNPGGPQRSEPTLAPTDLFAPLAPLPIPAHLLGPNADAEEVPSAEAASREGPARSEPASDPKVFGPAVALLPGPELPASGLDGPQGGELSRCSSLSSLSREVSQHFNQAPGALTPAGAPPGAGVPFYNPAQFAQAPAASGSSRTGRIGQRKYPALS